MITHARLEGAMRQAAALQYDSQQEGPFVLFFHPTDPLRFFNYARPVRPFSPGSDDGTADDALARLVAAYEARNRMPRFEFVEEYAPSLPAILKRNGFTEEARQWLMLCDAASYRPAAPSVGIEVRDLTPGSPNADLRAFVAVQRQGFSGDDAATASEAEGEDVRDGLRRGNRAFLALLDGEPMGAGGCSAPVDGLTELVGIATRLAYRRRGVATALTSEAVAALLADGVEAVFLTAEDEKAGRVYERAGFRPFGVSLAYAIG